jgi:hypothetical protein
LWEEEIGDILSTDPYKMDTMEEEEEEEKEVVAVSVSLQRFS